MTSPLYVDRRGSASAKWDGAEKYFGVPNVLPLWMADMDFQAPPAVLQRLRAAAEHGVYGYTLGRMSAEVAIRDWYSRRHAWDTSAAQVVRMPFGAKPALRMLLHELVPGSGSIAVLTPSYPGLLHVIARAGFRTCDIRLEETPSGYRIDLERAGEVLADVGTKAIVLCSPHNPTGRVWSKAELGGLVALCREHDVLLIADEVHSDLVYTESRHIPVGLVAAEYGLCAWAVLHSVGKTFNLSGIPGCFVVAPSELVSRFRARLRFDGFYEGGLIPDLATEAAFRDCDDWLACLMEYLCEGRDRAVGELRRAGIAVHAPEATFLLWIKVAETSEAARVVFHQLVQQERVGLHRGSEFGAEGERHLRLNFATNRPNVDRAIAALIDVLRRGCDPL